VTSDQTPSALLLANLPLIRELVDLVARRNHLDAERARDLESLWRRHCLRIA